MQRGYPSRIPYDDIYSRYAPLMPDFVTELGAMLNGPEQALRPLLLTLLTTTYYLLLTLPTTYYSHYLPLTAYCVLRTTHHSPRTAAGAAPLAVRRGHRDGIRATGHRLPTGAA